MKALNRCEWRIIYAVDKIKPPKVHSRFDYFLSFDALSSIHQKAENDFGHGTPEQRHVLKMLMSPDTDLLETYPFCGHMVYCIYDKSIKKLIRYRVQPDGKTKTEIIPIA